MKKLLIASVLASITLMATQEAHASIPAGIGSSAGGVTAALFTAGAVGEVALVYAIASGVDPWTPLFSKVVYTYPSGTNGQ